MCYEVAKQVEIGTISKDTKPEGRINHNAYAVRG